MKHLIKKIDRMHTQICKMPRAAYRSVMGRGDIIPGDAINASLVGITAARLL